VGFLGRSFRRSRARPDSDEPYLLVLTLKAGKEPGGWVELEEEKEMSFVLVEDEEGLAVLPAFTSEEALVRWQPEGSSYVAVPEHTLLEVLADSDWDRIAVDAADPSAFAITRAEAQQRLGIATHSLSAGSTMLIGDPATPPPEGFLEALRSACEREPDVSEGYAHQLAVLESDDPPHLAIGLRLAARLDEEELGRLVRAIGDEVAPARWGYELVDFQILDGELLEQVTATSAPIFRRA